MSVSIQQTLFAQADILAQNLRISQDHLVETAIKNFIREHQSKILPGEINETGQEQPDANEQLRVPRQDVKTATQIGGRKTVINQGDIHWIKIENPTELEPGIPHPYVVIQDNVFNHSRINTVIVCALTSNIKRASDTPGNVLLEVGESNLPRQSVVEVSKVSTVDKTELGEYIGTLTEQRVNQILAGMRFLQRSFFTR
jgi:mRNA interferase MazF